MSDFRGVEPGGNEVRIVGDTAYMGGICEFSASQGRPIEEDGGVYALQLPPFGGARFGQKLKTALRDQALGQHLITFVMQAEDAPQATNRVDLDGRYHDVYGQPVARVTYKFHEYERAARLFYVPHLLRILETMGAQNRFVAPVRYLPGLLGPPDTRHVLGTLRMGADPATSVTDAGGKFHDLDNLWACDGSVFPTSSGYNPTLTIIAVALKIAHELAGTPPGAA
jgi:choline dehydrogenase-like flavoprotein